MLEFIKNYITAVALMIIFVSVVMLMLPDNSFKKYVSFVTGLMVTIAVISPVFNLLVSKGNIEGDIARYIRTMEQGSSTVSDTDKYRKHSKEETISVYKDKLSEEILSCIKKNTGENFRVIDLGVSTGDENYGSISYVRLKDENLNNSSRKDKDKILFLLNKEFGIKASCIYIEG
jgi:stage III sporulation protein AF